MTINFNNQKKESYERCVARGDTAGHVGRIQAARRCRFCLFCCHGYRYLSRRFELLKFFSCCFEENPQSLQFFVLLSLKVNKTVILSLGSLSKSMQNCNHTIVFDISDIFRSIRSISLTCF